jgi:hypothetical protein
MSRSSLRLFANGLILVILLAACIPSTAQPAGPSEEEIKAQISTSVALTVSAQETELAAISSPTPTVTNTVTPIPTFTATATIIFPSLTPFPSSTPYISGGVPTLAPYGCSVANKTPGDNTVFKPNKDFDVKFSLWNIGTKTWDAGADLLFDSGTNMLTPGTTAYELPAVKSGAMVGPFIFDAKTPKKAGTYTMTFKVQGGFCYPYIRIIVQP